jgi:hypothetical protein
MPAFWHDPAVNVPPLPDLAPALSASWASGNPAHEGVLRAHLVRGRNRLAWALEQAKDAVQA